MNAPRIRREYRVEVNSFIGSMGGEHYYAEAKVEVWVEVPDDGTHRAGIHHIEDGVDMWLKHDLHQRATRKMTAKDAAYFNKKDRNTGVLLKRAGDAALRVAVRLLVEVFGVEVDGIKIRRSNVREDAIAGWREGL